MPEEINMDSMKEFSNWKSKGSEASERSKNQSGLESEIKSIMEALTKANYLPQLEYAGYHGDEATIYLTTQVPREEVSPDQISTQQRAYLENNPEIERIGVNTVIVGEPNKMKDLDLLSEYWTGILDLRYGAKSDTGIYGVSESDGVKQVHEIIMSPPDENGQRMATWRKMAVEDSTEEPEWDLAEKQQLTQFKLKA